jgi:hypothetical protein
MTKFHIYGATVKLQLQQTKTVEMKGKTVWRVNIWYFKFILKKLTIWNLTDCKKGQNKN